MRVAPPIVLTEAEEAALAALAASGPARRAKAAAIVLRAAEGLENKQIARRVQAAPNTVGRWRALFAVLRMAAFGVNAPSEKKDNRN